MTIYISVNLQHQPLISFYTVWCIICLQKGKYCGVFSGEGSNAQDKYICLQLVECFFFLLFFFFIFLSKLDLVFVVNDHVLECHAKKLGLYLQGQGHSEGL